MADQVKAVAAVPPKCDQLATDALYAKIVKAASKLDDSSDLNKWIKAMTAQIQDLVCRAASPKCAERRKEKLIYYWKLYKERRNAQAIK
jgi:hypothetical protein